MALRQLLTALTVLNTAESDQLSIEYFHANLQTGKYIHPTSALHAAQSWNIMGLELIVIEKVAIMFEADPTGHMAMGGIDWLDERWKSNQLEEISKAAMGSYVHGKGIVAQLATAIENSETGTGDRILLDHHKRTSALRVMAKCRTEDFVSEAIRLLRCPGHWHFGLSVCDALWVVGNQHTESELIGKYREAKAKGITKFYEYSRILRAMGTCGTSRGAAEVIEHIRTESDISQNLPDECLIPLYRRGYLLVQQLVDLVQCDTNSPSGRVACLIALSSIDAKGHDELFASLAQAANSSLVQAYAARLLRFTKDTSWNGQLQLLLRKTKDEFVAEQAAETLARLNDSESVNDIERALLDFATGERTFGFIHALEYFHQPSSVDVLLDVLESNHSLAVESTIIEALGAFLPDKRALQKIMEWLETWHGPNYDWGRQRCGVSALAQYSPQFFIEQANRLYESGHLHENSRVEIAHWLPSLTKQVEIDQTALLLLAGRLFCDQSFEVRETASWTLERIGNHFCRAIYEQLCAAKDSWSQACAIRMLGYWGNHESIIHEARYSQTFHERYFADVALQKHTKREAMPKLIEMYRSNNGLERLTAFYALQQHGTPNAMRTLYANIGEQDVAHIFLRQLDNDVEKSVEDELKKEKEKEQKRFEEIGTVYYGG